MYTYTKEFLFPVSIMGNLENCIFSSQTSRNHWSKQLFMPKTFTYNSRLLFTICVSVLCASMSLFLLFCINDHKSMLSKSQEFWAKKQERGNKSTGHAQKHFPQHSGVVGKCFRHEWLFTPVVSTCLTRKNTIFQISHNGDWKKKFLRICIHIKALEFFPPTFGVE